ncbi:hypothetical protein C7964_102378 [Loktanella sp. PT4BL]|jgi:hypothetical protein|uniref:hypothetical protein n=1 Tax=Loktanella sp. PT4BL TaxID=2135611 RepID=UPI000D76BC65|nr:hypothetical protein [Loktanella sp. PT4BL]PXW70488.1 hypothetical protein C7964_102378 [Loktanella sp. PT4BL]
MYDQTKAQVKIEEQSFVVAGLIEALVQLYPDVNGSADDDAYLAVLSQAQVAAQALRWRIEQLGNDEDITPLNIIG